jgi:hypothetical protein
MPNCLTARRRVFGLSAEQSASSLLSPRAGAENYGPQIRESAEDKAERLIQAELK